MARLMFKPSEYGIATMSSREIVAKNLRSLMDANERYGSTIALEKATAALGCKVGKSSIDRALKCKTPLNLDYIEAIAKVFGLDGWQLLTPGLRPLSPPVLRSVGEAEDQLYKKMSDLAKQIAQLEPRP